MYKIKVLIFLILELALAACLAYIVHAEEMPVVNVDNYVNAIFRAEGGWKAEYLYGVRSIKYKDAKEARRICRNSVKNNYKRWIKAGKPNDFIAFMGARYCPVVGKLTKAEKKLNKNWIKLVKVIYESESRKSGRTR